MRPFPGVLAARPTPADIPALHALYSDSRVWEHLPSGRFTEVAQTERMVDGWIEGWDRDGLSSWVLRDADTGELLGNGGCSLRRDTFWNLGYRLVPEAQGRGVATWVSREALEAAHVAEPGVPVVAYLLEHNAASARVAAKVGLTVVHRGPDAGNPDPAAIRLVFADRALSERQLAVVLEH